MAYIPASWRGAGVWRTSMSSSPLSESSVCHSLSPSVTPQSAVATHSPLMHLSILAMMAKPSLTYSAPQKGNMSSFSSHMALKRPQPSRGSSTLPLPIDQLNPRLHSSTYLSVFLSLCLAICLQSLPLVCMLTEDLSIAFASNQYVVYLSV